MEEQIEIGEASITDENFGTPPELKIQADEARAVLIPSKSAAVYSKWMKIYQEWAENNGVSKYFVSSNTLLAFFKFFGDKYAPSTLWTIFSCLKKQMLIYYQVDISKFPEVKHYLKVLNTSHKKKEMGMLEV